MAITGEGTKENPYIPENTADFIYLLTSEQYRRFYNNSNYYQDWIYIKLIYDIDLSIEVPDYEPDSKYPTSYIEIKNAIRVYSNNGAKLICKLPEKYQNTKIQYIFTLFDNNNTYRIGWNNNGYSYIAWYLTFEDLFIEFYSTPVEGGLFGSSLFYSVDKWTTTGHHSTISISYSKIDLYPPDSYISNNKKVIFYHLFTGGPGVESYYNHIIIHGINEPETIALFPIIDCYEIRSCIIEVENLYSSTDYLNSSYGVQLISNDAVIRFSLLYFGKNCYLKGSYHTLKIKTGKSYANLGNLIYISENSTYDKAGTIKSINWDTKQFGDYVNGKSAICSYNDQAQWTPVTNVVKIDYNNLTPETVISSLGLTSQNYTSNSDVLGGIPYPVYAYPVPRITEEKPKPPEPEKEYKLFAGEEHPYDLVLNSHLASEVYYGEEWIWNEKEE